MTTDPEDIFTVGPGMTLLEAYVKAIARGAELESLLEHVLNGFSFQGHPGVPCHRAGWVRDETLAKWRGILNHK